MTETSGKENLVIVNTRPSLVVLPEIKSKNPDYANGINLLPGENDVSSDYWEKAKKNPGVKIYLACGILKNTGKGTAKKLTDGLDALTTEQAKAQIEKCGEVQILQDWKDGTKKPALVKACSERIKEIIAATSGEVDG